MNTYEQSAANRMMQEDNEINNDIRKEIAFKKAKSNCPHCNGTGEAYHNGSYYSCSHDLSLEQRTFNGKIH